MSIGIKQPSHNQFLSPIFQQTQLEVFYPAAGLEIAENPLRSLRLLQEELRMLKGMYLLINPASIVIFVDVSNSGIHFPFFKCGLNNDYD